ncbi:hypothetical protein IMZ48_49975 [Candidatus Bathyarchaeota archaeon]|nr:hypothetical protein [Candidatus Bathyarchaeota archaeon]
MGASDSKLVFKKGIFRLAEDRHIPADDPYWTSVSSRASSIPGTATPPKTRAR